MNIYPSEKFFKFGSSPNAYHVSDTEINEWIIEKIKELESDLTRNNAVKGTGDTILYVTRLYIDDTPDSDYYYEALVAKNYEEADIYREEFEKLIQNEI